MIETGHKVKCFSCAKFFKQLLDICLISFGWLPFHLFNQIKELLNERMSYKLTMKFHPFTSQSSFILIDQLTCHYPSDLKCKVLTLRPTPPPLVIGHFVCYYIVWHKSQNQLEPVPVDSSLKKEKRAVVVELCLIFWAQIPHYTLPFPHQVSASKQLNIWCLCVAETTTECLIIRGIHP